eukprot:205940-Amphidinium_carterae.1
MVKLMNPKSEANMHFVLMDLEMVAIPWMIIGVFYAALFLSSISLIIFGTDDVIDIHLSVYRDEMLNRMLFESMDRYHNNVVARDEFLSFMLVQNGFS